MSSPVQRPPVAVDVIESEELVQSISPVLLTLDYNHLRVKFLVAGGSFAFFSLIFTATLFLCGLFPVFRNLGLKFQVFLSLSVVRGIYGVFASIVGLYGIFYTTNLDRDVTFSKMLIIHHAIGVFSYTISVGLSANFSIGCKVLILEMSTPFSCLSYLLLKVGMERSVWWRLNQMFLVHTFHLRSVVECYLWYFTLKHWQYIWNFLPTSLLILTYTGLVLVTFVMTPYWGYKKTQQLFNPVDWNFEDSNKHGSRQSTVVVNGAVKNISVANGVANNAGVANGVTKKTI
ncbi:unnamed protein product [Candidula unifasciata]|uniref:TLC domain-containing protein n=1 Tax=Candidula unifasciata TaxID=100452 RepID=A0A8S3YY13_9EUPU|nr:unnamed protein product [Candidula unifasciata]